MVATGERRFRSTAQRVELLSEELLSRRQPATASTLLEGRETVTMGVFTSIRRLLDTYGDPDRLWGLATAIRPLFASCR